MNGGSDEPSDRTNHVENLKQHGLRDGGVELADVKGSGRRGHLSDRGIVCRRRGGNGGWSGSGGRRSLGDRNGILGLSDSGSGHVF